MGGCEDVDIEPSVLQPEQAGDPTAGLVTQLDAAPDARPGKPSRPSSASVCWRADSRLSGYLPFQGGQSEAAEGAALRQGCEGSHFGLQQLRSKWQRLLD